MDESSRKPKYVVMYPYQTYFINNLGNKTKKKPAADDRRGDIRNTVSAGVELNASDEMEKYNLALYKLRKKNNPLLKRATLRRRTRSLSHGRRLLHRRPKPSMSKSEVFRPANGDLVVRDPVSNGPVVNDDYLLRRPSSMGGYRFGQLSHNSFFTRHNPHPSRVRHIKGLLDIPICSVNDDGYFANPRYSLNFPPDSYSEKKLTSYKTRVPVNAMNVNSQLHPINTVTGLQYFTGLNSYPFREKAIPHIGLVPVTEAWRDELKAFTQQLQQVEEKREEKQEERPRTTQYSASTGRLIPPPSRAMSRAGSRRGVRPMKNMFQHIAAEPDVESTIFSMLCQILQTDDVNAVQAWLCSASPSEKGMVQDLIKSAISGREEYWKQYPAEYMDDRSNKLPPINEKHINGLRDRDEIESIGDRVQDRLILDEVLNKVPDIVEPSVPVPPPTQPHLPMNATTPKPMIEDDEFNIEPPSNTVFKTNSKRPPSQAYRIPTAQRSEYPPPGTGDARLKYTKAPLKDYNMQDSLWQQHKSVNTF